MKTTIVEKKTVEYTVNLELTIDEAKSLRNILGSQYADGEGDNNEYLINMLGQTYPELTEEEVTNTRYLNSQLFNDLNDGLSKLEG